MRRVYQGAGSVLLLLALVVAWQSIGLRYYTPIGPGPGFFPLWLSGILAVFAVAIIVEATVRPHAPLPGDFIPVRANTLRIAGATGAILVIALAIATFGFRVTMFAFYVTMLPMLGRRNWLEILVLATAGSFGVFEVFDRILKTPLPTGLFGF